MKTLANILFSAICLCVTGCGDNFSLKVIIPQVAIQKSVDGYFPMATKDDPDWEAPVDITLSDAKVILKDGSDQIGFDIKIVVDSPNSDESKIATPKLPGPPLPKGGPPQLEARTIEGSVSIFVGLRYESAEAKFYCLDPKIQELHFDELPDQFDEPVRRATERLLTEYLARNSVYTLTDDQTSTSATKAVLKSIKIEDGTAYAELGADE